MPPNAHRWERLQTILGAALDAEPADRPALLDDLCEDDDALRAEVEDLLAHAEEADDFLEAPAVAVVMPSFYDGVSGDEPDGEEALPDRVGPYRPLRLLGRGGMGEVFLVERADGLFERQVALKRIRVGLDVPGVARRFEAERRILAALQHPGIARLLDAGTDAAGRPYFAMDHVEGERITRFAETRMLSVEARLDLVEQVCEAVHYAHRRLIVHRDLKPSNILVTEAPQGQSGAKPTVKLLDFGIAKLLEHDEAEPLTLYGPSPMTRAYAAPEQVSGQPTTTASDVYALGVILYELLTGKLPYDGSTEAQFEQAILTAEPPPPSARQRSPDHVPPTDPARLRGDLDAICLKALAKDPADRYDSAMALADDLRRHRTGQPIEARPPSVAYRLRKYVARHRVGVAMTAAFVLAVVALTGVYISRLTTERNRAAEQAARAEEALTFMDYVLSSANPFQTNRRDTLRMGDLLDGAVLAAADSLVDQPTVQDRIHTVLGNAYSGIGRWHEADSLFRLALPGLRDTPLAYANTARGLANVLVLLGGEERELESIALNRQSLEALREVGSPDTADLHHELGIALNRRGEAREAEAHFLQSTAAFRERGHTAYLAISLGQYAMLLRDHGRPLDAERMLREVVTLNEEVHGATHPHVGVSSYLLALTLGTNMKHAEAEAAVQRAASIYEQALGPTHPNTLDCAVARHVYRVEQGQPDAVDDLGTAVAQARTSVNARDPRLPFWLLHYAKALNRAQRFVEARTVIDEGLPLMRAIHGADHHGATSFLLEQALATLDRDGFEQTQARFTEAVGRYDGFFGRSDNIYSAQAHFRYTRRLIQAGLTDEAAAVARASVSLHETQFGPGHPRSEQARAQLREV
ncbi:MAG: serine/threonine-protein kinase [Bacteroidota bacterium]